MTDERSNRHYVAPQEGLGDLYGDGAEIGFEGDLPPLLQTLVESSLAGARRRRTTHEDQSPAPPRQRERTPTETDPTGQTAPGTERRSHVTIVTNSEKRVVDRDGTIKISPVTIDDEHDLQARIRQATAAARAAAAGEIPPGARVIRGDGHTFNGPIVGGDTHYPK